ncbi:MAG: DUF4834 domain-containing protein [Capnocytophaga sp.]|nr:DUF4834 domain-containing protein [Capnocytophaga sp.]
MIVEASFEGFLSVLFGFGLVVFLFLLALRFFFPLLLRYLFKKAEKNLQQQFGSAEQSTQDTTYTQSAQSKNPVSTKKVGEYIEYEEID